MLSKELRPIICKRPYFLYILCFLSVVDGHEGVYPTVLVSVRLVSFVYEAKEPWKVVLCWLKNFANRKSFSWFSSL